MLLRPLRRGFVAVFVLFAFLFQGTFALAGTTGTLSGTATDAATNAPIAGAKVTVASPSQVATTTTDPSGHFSFLSLIPDTYIVSIQREGYEDTSISGVTITADNARTLTLSAAKALKVIGRVTTRSAGSLVKPGTTSDVYSIDSTAQSKAAVAGGGGTQNSAFSALSTVPGVFVAPGQSGYIGAGASLSIRGGDYDQIGYEIDGVPVNRAFDDYPSGPTSSLGQQELQVYTGGGPASSEAQGLSGFINQVIRTGTSPGFVLGDVSVGGPSFYHKAAIEFGGATTNRNFSYYVGIGGYDQDFRANDQFNGRGVGQLFGTPLAPCPTTGITAASVPSCFAPNGTAYGTNVFLYNSAFGGAVPAYVLGSNNLFGTSEVIDRDNVINLHLAIPRKSGLKDDIQLLGMVNALKTYGYDSLNDQGGAAYLGLIGLGTTYQDGLIYNGPTGTVVPANYQSLISSQNFPHSADPTGRLANSPIPANLESDNVNDQGILKLQWTHPFSQNALFRLYGYTYYSDWLQTDPQYANSDFLAFTSPDYELSSHTRGLSGAFIDQINSQNLVQLQGSYTTATTLRDNNTGFLNQLFGGARNNFAYLVDGSNPTDGLCYAAGGGPAISCVDPGVAKATLTQASTGSIPAATGTCGGGPCEYLITGNGQYATYNTVKPIFYSASLTDDFHPTSKLTINGGLRMDIFQFQGASTAGTAARTFFYNAFNQDNCLSASQALVAKEPLDPCPAGTTAADFVNPLGIVTESYTEFEPRLGATYSLDPSTVLRVSYGRYSQAPNSAFQQYDALQQNAPSTLYSTYGFQEFGFNSPDHTVKPPTSNNYDFSVEHSFPGQVSIKVSPFFRKTQDQIQQFFLNQQSGFVSGLNVGRQTSDGVEFELDKGDFNRDGLAAKLSFTYTNSFINYQALSTGASIITPLNLSISQYNAYTSACAAGGAYAGKTAFGQPICGATPSGNPASACYSAPAAGATYGLPVACGTAGAVANPYWNAPVQGLLDPNGSYATYDTFPAGIGTSSTAYGAPYVATLILNYKKGPFSITPVLQMFAGQKYGTPNSTEGVTPDACGALAGSTTGDPRYPYGTAGGAPFDATACGLGLSIPDPYTKAFDGIGAFTEPTLLSLNLRTTYDLSKNLTIVASLTNLVNSCFGGTKVGFAVGGACAYGGLLGGGTTGDVGNSYNPGATIQPYTNTPYLPSFGANAFPTSLYVSAQLKL